MPIVIINNHNQLSLNELLARQRDGYSVLKSPHVGNQHPSNLLCARLGIPMEMVTFTVGERDKNFHPHLRIEGSEAVGLFAPTTLTQFATVPDGRSATAYHQSSVQQVFPNTNVCTDVERMRSELQLSERVLRLSNSAIKRLWYRMVSAEGVLEHVRFKDRLSDADLESGVFQVTNQASGWVVPNRVHALFDFIWQSLSSGRDSVYHLSGPDMVGYISGIKNSLSTAYDAVRQEVSELPEQLTLYVVPVASCRFVTHRDRVDSLTMMMDTIAWYERLPNDQRRFAGERFAEAIRLAPEFTTGIEAATYMSQYDLSCGDDLLISDWMLDAKLSRVEAMHSRLCKIAARLVKAAA